VEILEIIAHAATRHASASASRAPEAHRLARRELLRRDLLRLLCILFHRFGQDLLNSTP
jgi:hypothetical protein